MTQTMTAYFLRIHLADNEYGSTLMRTIAEEILSSHPHKERLVVNVYEHGGWWLEYALVGGEVKIVGSANDRAQWSEPVRAWWEWWNKCKAEYLPTIRRQAQGEVVAT